MAGAARAGGQARRGGAVNWLDLVIILVILGFVIAAYSAGLIREVITLVAVLAGVVIAGVLYDDLAKDVLVFLKDEEAARAIAFLVLFGAVYLFGQVSAYVLKSGAALLMLGWWDHLGGAVFGFFKGIIFVQALLIIFAGYPSLHLDSAVDDSALGRFFLDDISFLLRLLPADFRHRVDEFLAPPGI